MNGATVLGAGSYINAGTGNTFMITMGATTPIAITIAPQLAGPALGIETGQAIAFFKEGHNQSIFLAANELDPVGDIITTYYGPVSDWLPLTLSLTNGTSGVSFVGGTNQILAAPSAPTGSAIGVQYDGVSNNAVGLTVNMNDTVNPSATLTIPFVFMSASTNPGNAINVHGTNVNVTVTESITAGTVPDANFISSSNCPLAHVAIAPLVGVNPVTPTGFVTYSVTGDASGAGTCNFSVSSFMDSNLTESITVTY
jgi:hypothetical protein